MRHNATRIAENVEPGFSYSFSPDNKSRTPFREYERKTGIIISSNAPAETEQQVGTPHRSIQYEHGVKEEHGLFLKSNRKQDFVAGAVVSYDENSVRCNLNMTQKNVEVSLARGMFGMDIRVGLPIILSVVVDPETSVKQYVIKQGSIDSESNSLEQIETMENIIRSL